MTNLVVAKTPVALALTLALTLASQHSFAAEEASPSGDEQLSASSSISRPISKQVEVISIFGSHNQLETATGSAVVIGAAQLELFEFDDIHRVLQSVPGVYIREEDGYGLRPNIGLRGATSERSSKIALMEDGILIAPAPYAAPAAYYFPMMSRMTQVEIFKGPSAIQYGPNTVGGAINMVSRGITENTVDQGGSGMIDLAYGQDNYQKAHGYYSQNIASDNALTGKGQIGVLIEGIHLGSDGFKTLTDSQGNSQDTGFEKNEVIMKLNYVPSSSESNQFFQFKMGYGEETSNETYLGLTDEDFAEDGKVRYLASQKDQMDWEHYQFQLSHYIELSDELSLFSQAYHREFDRDWDRFNSFNTNRSMQTILTSPDTGVNKLFMEVLRGDRDSLTDKEALIFTLNDRRYYSKGIETKLTWDTSIASAEVIVDSGIRLHQDNVTRKHTASYYDMKLGVMERNGTPSAVITHNDDTATAVAAFTNVNAVIDNFHITLGLRVEHIEGEAIDYQASVDVPSISKNSDTVFLPGAGLFYQLTAEHGLLVGVNKGYVPNSPGQASNVAPEESWNYEFGWRYSTDDIQGEVIGFYNDYSNLKGACTFSSGCTQKLDQEFNGGEVDVYGIEASTSISWQLTESIKVPVKVAYTYSQSDFQNSFDSTFSQWGSVEVGDELPYLPEQQLSIETGLQAEYWQASLMFKYITEMSEAAGSNTELEGLTTDELIQVDFSAWYQVNKQIKLYGKVDNITDEAVIVSRRPFGARPGKPRQVIVGVKYSF
ncbi:MAG: TonB-dependent receptor [Colwellia sp.]|uniref:TonB-dependent receptor family protein n=1 Tax=Colwellia sp. TaxID=56799 RepID=UPI001DA67965|nr:TonB-dependent receptor [Colwellia sp.]NQY50371.1 TonB-dependent receptor [Colwellia sp.]